VKRPVRKPDALNMLSTKAHVEPCNKQNIRCTLHASHKMKVTIPSNVQSCTFLQALNILAINEASLLYLTIKLPKMCNVPRISAKEDKVPTLYMTSSPSDTPKEMG
jgi:hypothetical protein